MDVLKSEIKTKIKGFKQMLSIKGVAKKLLITAGMLFGTWLVSLIGQKICADKVLKTPFVLKLIAFLSFSNAGVSNNLFYQLGGMVGKTLVSTTIFAVVLGGMKMLKGGVVEFIHTVKKLGNRDVLPLFLYGAGAALILYNFFTGEAYPELAMAGIAGVLSMLWAIGGGVHFIRRMVVALTADVEKKEKLRYVNYSKTYEVLSGMAAGFLLGIPVSFIPWGFVAYSVGAAAILAGIVLHITANGAKRTVAAVLLVFLLASCVIPAVMPVTDVAYAEDDWELVTKEIGPDEQLLPNDFHKSDRWNWLAPNEDGDVKNTFEFEVYHGVNRIKAEGHSKRRTMQDKDKVTYTMTDYPYGMELPYGSSPVPLHIIYSAALEETARFFNQEQYDNIFNNPEREGKMVTVKGHKAFFMEEDEIGTQSQMPGDPPMPYVIRRYWVLMDDEVVPGLKMVLYVRIRGTAVGDGCKDYPSGMPELGEGWYDNNNIEKAQVRLREIMDQLDEDWLYDTVEEPFTYSVTMYVDQGITLFDKKTGRAVDFGKFTVLTIMLAILTGTLGELVAMFGALGYDFGGYFGGTYYAKGQRNLENNVLSDKWVSFDKDGDIEYIDPVTGEKSQWVKQENGKYKKVGDFTEKTENELREQAEWAERNQNELKKTADQHEKNVQHNRENQAEFNKRKEAAAKKMAEEKEKQRKYTEKLAEKYGEYDPEKLKKAIKKETIKNEVEKGKWEKAEAYAAYGEEYCKAVKSVCDNAIDGIAAATNYVPVVGEKAALIKKIYNSAVPMVSELSEAYATDGSYLKAAAIGANKAAIAYVQNSAESPLGKAGANILGEAFNGMMDAGKEGKSLYNGFIDGAAKGTINTVVDMGAENAGAADGHIDGAFNAIYGNFKKGKGGDAVDKLREVSDAVKEGGEVDKEGQTDAVMSLISIFTRPGGGFI